MKTVKRTVVILMACMLLVLASQNAFAAIKIVKLTVPGCE